MNNEMSNEPREPLSSGLSISESELFLLVRPALSSFDWDCPSYHRWYEYGGIPRARPLDREELTQLLLTRFSQEDADESASCLTFINQNAVWEALDTLGRISVHQGGTTVTWNNGQRVRAESY